ncbi:MAG: DinB family protein [Asgard group archaeon]|nr:DinB family protein [Asgard group archaeon]
MNQTKINFYLEIIRKSHDAFKEFLVHLPEGILNWELHEFANTVNWMVQHIIHDQMWIANVILNNQNEGKHFKKESKDITLEDMLETYDNLTSKTESMFQRLKDEHLTESRSYKDYLMSVEEWFFEYIHHLNQHAGELALYLTIWKREQRSSKN